MIDLANKFVAGYRYTNKDRLSSIVNCSFHNSLFTEADMSGVNIFNSDLLRSHFQSCCISSALLVNNHFDYSYFKDVTFNSSIIKATTFKEALLESCIIESRFTCIEFVETKFINISFTGCKFIDVTFTDCTFKNCVFDEFTPGVTFTDCTFIDTANLNQDTTDLTNDIHKQLQARRDNYSVTN